MNELKVFQSSEFESVTVIDRNDGFVLIGSEIAKNLGYSNPQKAIRDHVDGDDKLTERIVLAGQTREVILINESGLYSLVLSSKLPNAKRFKKWVTSEVLPSIRKHGAYMSMETIEKTLLSPDFIIQLAGELKKEKEARQAAEENSKRLENEVVGLNDTINEMKPKVDYVDRILKSTSLVTTTQIAKDYGMGAPSFNKKLKELKVQHKVGGQWVLTYKYQGKGYASSETIDIELEDGRVKTVMQTKWTQKGRLFIHDLLKEEGIVPLIEQM